MKVKQKQMKNAGDDKWFIQHPGEWPRWPFLPMKHRERIKLPTEFGTGLLAAYSEAPVGQPKVVAPVILHLNLYALPDLPGGNSVGALIKYCEERKLATRFGSLDELLAAGWVVD